MSLYTQVLEPWLTQPIILRGSSNPVMPSASTTGNSAPVETISFASGSKQPNVFEGLLINLIDFLLQPMQTLRQKKG